MYNQGVVRARSWSLPIKGDADSDCDSGPKPGLNGGIRLHTPASRFVWKFDSRQSAVGTTRRSLAAERNAHPPGTSVTRTSRPMYRRETSSRFATRNQWSLTRASLTCWQNPRREITHTASFNVNWRAQWLRNHTTYHRTSRGLVQQQTYSVSENVTGFRCKFNTLDPQDCLLIWGRPPANARI